MKIDHFLDIISGTRLFLGFSKTELYGVFSNNKYDLKEYEKDEIIHLQNEICNSIDIILCGKVKVQNIDEDGNIFTINVVSEGDMIGANIIYSSKKFYPMTIAAISKVTILHMKRDLILELCQTNINFMLHLLQEISDRTVFLTDKITKISFKTIREMIIEFLKYESMIQKSNSIKLNATKKDLAERFGIQRSSLSRELNKMRKAGMIEYDAWTITVKSLA